MYDCKECVLWFDLKEFVREDIFGRLRFVCFCKAAEAAWLALTEREALRTISSWLIS